MHFRPSASAPQRRFPPGRASKALHDTLDQRSVLGFPGCFTCPKVVGGEHWGHWIGKGGLAVDMLPDVTDFPADELCPTGQKGADGA